MRHIYNERGAALVVVLAMVVISTAVFAVVLHFVERGTETSGLEQKYETAKDASLGALDVFAKEIIPAAIGLAQADPDHSLALTINNTFNATGRAAIDPQGDPCFGDKVLKSTANWAVGCSKSADPKTAPDVVFTLQGTRGVPFSVYTKIIDTATGNTNMSGILLEGSGVADSSSSTPSPQHFPYMYSMEVQGERQEKAIERANLEVLYAY